MRTADLPAVSSLGNALHFQFQPHPAVRVATRDERRNGASPATRRVCAVLMDPCTRGSGIANSVTEFSGFPPFPLKSPCATFRVPDARAASKSLQFL